MVEGVTDPAGPGVHSCLDTLMNVCHLLSFLRACSVVDRNPDHQPPAHEPHLIELLHRHACWGIGRRRRGKCSINRLKQTFCGVIVVSRCIHGRHILCTCINLRVALLVPFSIRFTLRSIFDISASSLHNFSIFIDVINLFPYNVFLPCGRSFISLSHRSRDRKPTGLGGSFSVPRCLCGGIS